jgi:hypothetical protein
MAVKQEDKGFHQFDWSRAKICPLGLHIRGLSKRLHINTSFVNFGAKNLAGEQKFVHDIYGNPDSR